MTVPDLNTVIPSGTNRVITQGRDVKSDGVESASGSYVPSNRESYSRGFLLFPR